MVMIRCPHCGARALDIATSCPQCHRILIQNPLETHNWGALRECGRCHKHIERDAVLCPYCGHRVRAARLAGRTAAVVAALVVLVAAGVAAWRSGIVNTLRDALVADRSAVQESPPPAAAEPESLPVSASTQVAASPILAALPADSAPAMEPRPPQPSAPRPVGARVPAASLVRRWTSEWANVRAARDVTSEVVRVLAPNLAVEVGDMRQGWWALYSGGALVGYIANSVLRTEPLQS
jgi:DNA-directed RNA polymerase subunit RPC12/RpoP